MVNAADQAGLAASKGFVPAARSALLAATVKIAANDGLTPLPVLNDAGAAVDAFLQKLRALSAKRQ